MGYDGDVTRPITLVTGASAGLGTEFARACAARGDEVVLVARRMDRLEEIATEIGGKAHVIATDLSEREAPAAVLAQVEALGLTVDTMINNAGFGGGGRVAEQSLERQIEMIDLNIRALTELARRVVPAMLGRGRGGILNVAST